MDEEQVFLGIIEQNSKIKDQLKDKEPWKVNKIGEYLYFR